MNSQVVSHYSGVIYSRIFQDIISKSTSESDSSVHSRLAESPPPPSMLPGLPHGSNTHVCTTGS